MNSPVYPLTWFDCTCKSDTGGRCIIPGHDPVTIETAYREWAQWMDTYGKDLPFQAKQAFIPLADFLFEQSPQGED